MMDYSHIENIGYIFFSYLFTSNLTIIQATYATKIRINNTDRILSALNCCKIKHIFAGGIVQVKGTINKGTKQSWSPS